MKVHVVVFDDPINNFRVYAFIFYNSKLYSLQCKYQFIYLLSLVQCGYFDECIFCSLIIKGSLKTNNSLTVHNQDKCEANCKTF